MPRLFAVVRSHGPGLTADPWTRSGLLVVKQIVPWQVRLGRLT
jgi:hypothetical protein